MKLALRFLLSSIVMMPIPIVGFAQEFENNDQHIDPKLQCVLAAQQANYNDPVGYCAQVQSDAEAQCVVAAVKANYSNPIGYCGL